MSKEFSYPEFENGVKVLTRAGDAVNDMMMNITVYRMKAGEKLAFRHAAEETAVLLVLGKVVFEWDGHQEIGQRNSLDRKSVV